MPIWRLEELEMGNTSIRASCLHQIALALELPVSFFFPDAQGHASDVDEGQAEILTTEQALALVQSYYRIPRRQRQNLSHLGDMVGAIGYQPTGAAQGSA